MPRKTELSDRNGLLFTIGFMLLAFALYCKFSPLLPLLKPLLK